MAVFLLLLGLSPFTNIHHAYPRLVFLWVFVGMSSHDRNPLKTLYQLKVDCKALLLRKREEQTLGTRDAHEIKAEIENLEVQLRLFT